MCAAFDEDIEGVKVLLKQARQNSQLREVLGFTNTVEVTKCSGATGENILFIKKNSEIFELCCNAALEWPVAKIIEYPSDLAPNF